MKLSDNLKKIRKEHNLSQEQLAEQLGVSRQSVSKWESGLAYPEMDKMIQLCQLFHLNIDELLNQDIDTVNNKKKANSYMNQYISDVLDYITKTINMFSVMSSKETLKCIMEQLGIIGFMFIIFAVVGVVGTEVIKKLFSFLPIHHYASIYAVLEAIYIFICFIISVILLLHIFKIRYLNYFEYTRENKIINVVENDNMETLDESRKRKKWFFKKEHIVIRDPENSEYHLISGLIKILLIMLRVIAGEFSILLCFTFVLLIVLIVLSFLVVKTGIVFIGTLLLLLSLLGINFILLFIFYHFIATKNVNANKLALSFILLLIVMGIAIGCISIGLTSFKIVNDINSDNYIVEEVSIEMRNDLVLNSALQVKYVESDNEDIKVISKHSAYQHMGVKVLGNTLDIVFTKSNALDRFRIVVQDLNQKEIVDYYVNGIYIYTTKENIQKLTMN